MILSESYLSRQGFYEEVFGSGVIPPVQPLKCCHGNMTLSVIMNDRNLDSLNLSALETGSRK